MPEMRDLVGRWLWKMGVTKALVKHVGRLGRFALAMHGVSPAYDPGLPRKVQPHHTAKEMEQTLSFLKDHLTFLSPQAFLETENPGVLLTFDDGFANNAEVLLPILEKFDAPAVFFVTTQHVINPRDWLPATRKIIGTYWDDIARVPKETADAFFDGMSVDQLKICARHPLITIGSHTLSHPFLSRCSEEELEREISGSKQLLEELCGKKVDLFAYPTGDYDLKVIRQVERARYRAAFAVDTLGLDTLRYEIPRVGLYLSDEAYLGLKLSGLHRRPLQVRILDEEY